MPRPILAALTLTLPLLSGCTTGGHSPMAPTSSADAPDRFAAELTLCVDDTNRYRTTVGLAPLGRSTALEAYAAAAARTDGLAKKAHEHARLTNQGNGASRAENAILWWSLRYYGSVDRIVARGLSDMWNQGADGVHRRNIAGPYQAVGCGIFVNGDEVTVVQAFL